jgi:4-deoxy-L-threo-5-hexosulose-uronate ketol-isomerase
MDVRYSTGPEDFKHYTTEQVRKEFLIENAFVPEAITLTYSHVDRMVAGAALPLKTPLSLLGGKELSSEYFLERRELGTINIGGPGFIVADGKRHDLNPRDGLYIGRGTKEVSFGSIDPAKPAKFWINSAPAHAAFPTEKVDISKAEPAKLGSAEECNKRTIYKYFHPQGVRTCQLVMGLTVLEPGSVWNTMPCHTHERRMEVYLYFDMSPDTLVFHYMGRPDETRHLIMRNEQAVISPSWSIHSGCATRAYAFIWGMAGENQTFNDMDGVGSNKIR